MNEELTMTSTPGTTAAIAFAIAVLSMGTAEAKRRDQLNLNGHWTLVSDDAAPAPDAATQTRWNQEADSFCGTECEVTQTASTLVIVRDQYPEKPKISIRLDGTESTNVFVTPSGSVTFKTVETLNGQSLRLKSDYSRADVRSQQDLTITIDQDQLVVTRQLRRGRGTGDVRKQRYSKHG
jgi:hypothetical protein